MRQIWLQKVLQHKLEHIELLETCCELEHPGARQCVHQIYQILNRGGRAHFVAGSLERRVTVWKYDIQTNQMTRLHSHDWIRIARC